MFTEIKGWRKMFFAACLVLSSGVAQGQDVRQECLAAYREGEAFLKQSRLAEAARAYETAVALAPKAFGEEHADTANIINNLAFIYQRMAEYGKAEPLYKRSLKIREKTLGPDHPAVAGVLNSMGEMYRVMGRFAEAETQLQRSLRIREEKTPNQPALAGTLNNLGLLHKDWGQYEKALSYYQRGLKIYEEKLPNSYQLATTLDNLLEIYVLLDRVANVEPLQRRSLIMFEDNLGKNHPETAICLNNIGFVLHRKLGQLDQAEPYYLRCLEIQEAKLPAHHPNIAQTLTNLGILYQAKRQFAKAEDFLQRSYEIRQKLPAGHPHQATSLNDLGFLHEERGNYAQAERLYKESIKAREIKLGKDHPDQAQALTNLGVLYLLQGKFADAEPLLQRSLKIREAHFGVSHPEVALNLGHLSVMHAANKDWDKALQTTERDLRIVRHSLARVLSILTDREQLDYLQKRSKDLHASLSFGLVKEAGIAEKSASWVLNFKGIAQQTLAERTVLERASTDSKLQEMVGQLKAVRRQLATLTFSPTPKADLPVVLERLQDEEQKLAKQLAQNLGETGRDDPWVELGEVRKALPDKAVLIEIARFRFRDFQARDPKRWWQEPRYAAWIIPPHGKGQVQVVDLGDAKTIETLVADFQQTMNKAADVIRKEGEPDAEKELRVGLEKLAQRVLHPILRQVGQAEHLILGPDADLWLVPWAALPVDKDRYALEKYQISYVVSGRDLVQKGFRTATGSPVIFADPDFNLAPDQAQAETLKVLQGKSGSGLRGNQSREKLPPTVSRLPGTAAEAEAITPKLEKFAGAAPQVFLDRQALEGVFKSRRNPKVLVASTHGFFLEDQTLDPTPSTATLENPLLRCGLLLAGCNQRQKIKPGDEDGVLTGLEIVGTDLRGTELVVLSACQTGLGKVHVGEGVAGLRQAFQLAGARSVVATLWQIPDRDSAILMSKFFGHLADKQTPADALRNAQLEVLSQRRNRNGAAHPFFWAAFTFTGR